MAIIGLQWVKEQSLTSFSSTYCPLSFYKILKRANPELWGCPIFGPKIAQFVLNKIFLVQAIIITFIYLLALFIGQNWKKILTVNPELWECIIFEHKMVHLPQTKNFFEKKIINIIFIYLLAPFYCAKLKKNSYSGSRVLRMHHFWAQNNPFAQMRTFFRKSVNKPSVPFIHAYLCAKNPSQIFIY